MPKINFSKVESLSVVATEDGFIAQLTYKSGQRRGLTFEPSEPVDRFIAEAERAGVNVIYPPLPEPELTDVTSPKALIEVLALAPEQAKHLAGATRLNFWRNGCLNVQIEHGSRAVKVKCPQAIVTDEQLSRFFSGWGWQQLGNKPYFRANHDSLVRL